MIDRLVLESTYRLNIFPAKGGVSSYYSPQVILHRTVIEYSEHCAIPFGAYVQAADDDTIRKNTNQARTLDCIYLRPLRNQQGGHELLHLHSNKTITRHDITLIPISDTIIRLVEALAASQQQNAGLKFTDWRGNLKQTTTAEPQVVIVSTLTNTVM